MISVAMIYFARLSLTSLSHKEEMPVAFEAYKMPKWWGTYRHAGVKGKRRQLYTDRDRYIPSRVWGGVLMTFDRTRSSCLPVEQFAQ